ncbi:MAG: hypothetical protein AAGJ12_16525 [Bacteroidota bacterium]
MTSKNWAHLENERKPQSYQTQVTLKPEFETYRARKIELNQQVNSNGWSVKVYTITKHKEFRSTVTLGRVMDFIPTWISEVEQSKLPTHNNAFLIIHEGREGIWILWNWWTGGEMIGTNVFFSHFESPDRITKSPFGSYGLLCIWELEVFSHERASWIKNILRNADQPDFKAYAGDMLNTVL